jgi:hypothetical protein
MLCRFYLRRAIVYIPTYGIIEKGFYRTVEPVAVVPVSNLEALRQALHDTIARGNPSVPNLARGQWPQPVTLEHAGIKTWGEFNRGASYWGIEEDDGIFRIIGHEQHTREGWKEDPGKSQMFPAGSNVDEVVDRMIAILQAAAPRKRSPS